MSDIKLQCRSITLQVISCLWTTLPLHQLLQIKALAAFLLLGISDEIICHPPLPIPHVQNHSSSIVAIWTILDWLMIGGEHLLWLVLTLYHKSQTVLNTIGTQWWQQPTHQTSNLEHQSLLWFFVLHLPFLLSFYFHLHQHTLAIHIKKKIWHHSRLSGEPMVMC